MKEFGESAVVSGQDMLHVPPPAMRLVPRNAAWRHFHRCCSLAAHVECGVGCRRGEFSATPFGRLDGCLSSKPRESGSTNLLMRKGKNA